MLEWLGDVMEIGELIENALKDIELPVYFLKRADETSECTVYNYIENANAYGDMKESSTKYNVLLNVYTGSKVESTKKKVKDAMLDAGFKKVVIPNTVIEKNSMYNTAMQFKIGIVNQG